MKLLNKQVLSEYGFIELSETSNSDVVIMSKNNFRIILKPDGSCIYSNTGIDYPLKDLAALKKLYKEVKREELLQV
jgi:hypothetical protein